MSGLEGYALVLVILKVKGLNSGFAVYFSQNKLQSLDKNDSMQHVGPRRITNLDFWREWRDTIPVVDNVRTDRENHGN